MHPAGLLGRLTAGYMHIIAHLGASRQVAKLPKGKGAISQDSARGGVWLSAITRQK